MNKSELIERIVDQQQELSVRDVELAVKTMLEHMTQILAAGDRIEIRGFGSFEIRVHEPRIAHNPKTGEQVNLNERRVVHFKPGVELRQRVNGGK